MENETRPHTEYTKCREIAIEDRQSATWILYVELSFRQSKQNKNQHKALFHCTDISIGMNLTPFAPIIFIYLPRHNEIPIVFVVTSDWISAYIYVHSIVCTKIHRFKCRLTIQIETCVGVLYTHIDEQKSSKKNWNRCEEQKTKQNKKPNWCTFLSWKYCLAKWISGNDALWKVLLRMHKKFKQNV